MIIRLGYVAMSVKLQDCSSSKTISVKNLEKIQEDEAKLSKLRRITSENLRNTLRLLYYNAANEIKLFRFTSKLVPLATHPIIGDWNYIEDFYQDFAKIGQIVKEHKMRVSSHPDHFTLLNSPKPEVLEASLRDLEYHQAVFEAMDLPNAEMVMHVGGEYGLKNLSIQRFKDNYRNLPASLKHRLLLENDDKSFKAEDVLKICKDLNIPMVLDVHHHFCLNDGEDIGDLLPEVFTTWNGRLPKLHFSSPKSEKNCRAHADDIDLQSFYNFLLKAREINRDFDVMIEAKNKDVALFNLLKGLTGLKGIKTQGAAVIFV